LGEGIFYKRGTGGKVEPVSKRTMSSYGRKMQKRITSRH